MSSLPAQSELIRAFTHDLAVAWAKSRDAHPTQTPYAFVLNGVEGGPRLTPYVLTEEGLSRVAKKYLEGGYHDTLDEARTALRYSVADVAPNDLEESLTTVNSLLDPCRKILDEDISEKDAYNYLVEAAIPAFAELDRQNFFGTGVQREQILLVILMFDVKGDWPLDSAKRLNPPSVFQRFDDATRPPAGVFRSCSALALSADLRSLYFTGSAPNPSPTTSKTRTIREIVACDLLDDPNPSLVRRWNYSFPGFGDSVRDIAVTPDSRAILVLRQKVQKGKTSTLLVRFNHDSNEPTHEHACEINPASFALSPDGRMLAVVSRDGVLDFFDAATLEPLATRTLPTKANSLRFLRAGHLLVATSDALLDFSAPFEVNSSPTSIPIPAHHISTDANESMVAVSRWFPPPRLIQEGGKPKRDEGEELGVHLLNLPTLTSFRLILIPGYQLVSGVLSPDAKYLVCSACQMGTPRKFVIVFDTSTGQEYARRKYDSVEPAVFLPNRVLALPGSKITTTEALEFWTIPA